MHVSRARARRHSLAADRVIFLDTDEERQCAICFARMLDRDITVTNCGHLFHEDCLRAWKRNHDTCPKCRSRTQAFRITSDRLILARRIIPKSFC